MRLDFKIKVQSYHVSIVLDFRYFLEKKQDFVTYLK